MIRLSNVKLPLGYNDDDILSACVRELRIPREAIRSAALFRRSVDARHKDDIHYVTSVDVHLNINEKAALSKSRSKNAAIVEEYRYEPLAAKDRDKRPLIVGTGPAGLFCALTLIQSGISPIVIERGSDVDRRTRAVRGFWHGGDLDTECNV